MLPGRRLLKEGSAAHVLLSVTCGPANDGFKTAKRGAPARLLAAQESFI